MPRTKTPQRRSQVFSGTLAAVMEHTGINQVQLSDATGIVVSRINNYLHGKYRTIRPDHLERMVKAVTKDPQEHGELVRSYLLDLLPAAMQTNVRIEWAGGTGKATKQAAAHTGLVPSSTADALTSLRNMSRRSAKARARVELFAAILAEIHSA